MKEGISPSGRQDCWSEPTNGVYYFQVVEGGFPLMKDRPGVVGRGDFTRERSGRKNDSVGWNWTRVLKPGGHGLLSLRSGSL